MGRSEERSSRPRRKFSPEFKRDAVELVRANPDKTIKEIADELGIYDSSLGNWVRDANESDDDDELNPDERSELAELRKEVVRLRMERDLLKRATAFWVKESTE